MNRRSFLVGLLATTVAPALPPVIITKGFDVPFNGHLMRTALWNRQMKEMLLDELNSMKFTEVFDGTAPGS